MVLLMRIAIVIIQPVYVLWFIPVITDVIAFFMKSKKDGWESGNGELK